MPNNQVARDGQIVPTGADGHCPNCQASMWEYLYKLDVLHVLLLTAMAKNIKERMVQGMDFTLANQVHVPSLPVSHGTKCRTTQAAKFGLVVKLKGKGSRGVWAITRRGFDGLSGRPVPSLVKVFRNKIEERYSDRTTFPEAKLVHCEQVEAAIMRKKDPKRDHRKDLEDYQPEDWYAIAGVHEGAML